MTESMRLTLKRLADLLGDADFERLAPVEIRKLYTDELSTQNMDEQVDSPFIGLNRPNSSSQSPERRRACLDVA